MAKDTLATKGIPLNPAGIDDNSPLNADASFYQTRGVVSLGEQCLERITGKLLIKKYDTPVLGIHGSIGNQYYVETVDQLILYNAFAAPTFAPPFPSDIVGLKLWLKAKTLSQSDGTPVPIWTDSSGTVNDAFQATVGFQPLFKTNILNGKPIIRFDGIDDFLHITNDIAGGSFSCFVVCSLNISPSSQIPYASLVLLPYGTNYGCQMVARLGASTNWGGCSGQENASPFGDKSSGEDLVVGVFNILELTSSFGTGSKIYRNGVLKASHGSGCLGTSTLAIGGNFAGSANTQQTTYLNADIAEIIVFDSILLDVDRIRVEQYLQGEHAL